MVILVEGEEGLLPEPALARYGLGLRAYGSGGGLHALLGVPSQELNN